MSQLSGEVKRYAANERWNHWFTAILFVLLAASGLAFFHPAFWSLTAVLGGGESCDNLMKSHDWKWMGQIGDVLANRDDRLPEVGKYNAGQKLAYWAMLASMLALMVSGLIIWRQFFSHMFTIEAIRTAALVHAISGVVLILTIIVHVYAAIWVKGTIGAMTKGTVSRAWAKHHHPLWYRSLDK